MTDQPKPESEFSYADMTDLEIARHINLGLLLCNGISEQNAGFDTVVGLNDEGLATIARIIGKVRSAVAQSAPALGFSQWQDKLAFAICEELCDQLNAGVDETRELAARTVASTRVTESLRAHPPGAAGWQPIETAPKDGRKIIAFCLKNGKPHYDVTWWRTNKDICGYTGWGEFNERFWPATHWMPLPAPPSRDTQEERGEPCEWRSAEFDPPGSGRRVELSRDLKTVLDTVYWHRMDWNLKGLYWRPHARND
jgi:hypothetical protein